METPRHLDTAGLEHVSTAECFVLLRSVPVGRIVYTDRALPAIMPVNFAVDGDDVVIRTGEGSKLAAAARGAIVAFEVDEFDERLASGWSVVIVGQAREVLDPDERARLLDLPLHPFAPGPHDHVIVIRPEMISGRRIGVRALAS
ncbi:pyridoxamine 5'-phosphate oxidase family protein [Oerskovia flava]|uniref:pyridoxamine 5'-phosphate oxidase family protein n=1 Tax=Oerskovia flava TaxID=2986422 RepID=UPI00223EFF84|nr:pyridoxamine 5'-phosphate oxidase family protein [Oerskovia sp. JB1-3-2]